LAASFLRADMTAIDRCRHTLCASRRDFNTLFALRQTLFTGSMHTTRCATAPPAVTATVTPYRYHYAALQAPISFDALFYAVRQIYVDNAALILLFSEALACFDACYRAAKRFSFFQPQTRYRAAPATATFDLHHACRLH
jgi:hypothetical protein